MRPVRVRGHISQLVVAAAAGPTEARPCSKRSLGASGPILPGATVSFPSPWGCTALCPSLPPVEGHSAVGWPPGGPLYRAARLGCSLGRRLRIRCYRGAGPPCRTPMLWSPPTSMRMHSHMSTHAHGQSSHPVGVPRQPCSTLALAGCLNTPSRSTPDTAPLFNTNPDRSSSHSTALPVLAGTGNRLFRPTHLLLVKPDQLVSMCVVLRSWVGASLPAVPLPLVVSACNCLIGQPTRSQPPAFRC